ncbi:MAG: xanthine dehydrogenase family protein molybdopterin-binding subunit [Sphingomonadales bacterium]
MAETGIGAPVRRKEDKRFITGKGRYVADINRPHQCHAGFVRSPHAHARITRIDAVSALAAPGVVAVLTGADLAADGLGALPCAWMIHSRDGSEMKQPPHPVMATDTVRYVGEAVAVVLAESAAQARDALELVEVEYDELPAIVSCGDAIAPDAVQLHEAAPGNVCFEWEIGDQVATDKAFEAAHHISRIDLVNNRLAPNAMEPRAAVADYDAGAEAFTIHTTSQNPHFSRLVFAAFLGLAPEHKIRVVAPDVGGGFGSKIFVYSEETVCAWASRRIGRPVKWTADRSEAFLTDAHGRDHVSHAELAMDENGKFLGLRVKTRANLGAYLSTFGGAVPTFMHATLLAGQYATPAIHAQIDAIFTNTTPVDAYRGAGRPEATYLLERLIETAARDIGIDPAELRRRNFIPTEAFPYETPVGLTYDIGDYEASLSKALAEAGYDGFSARKTEAARRGKLRGIGLACYIEASGAAPSQVAAALGAGAGLFESAQVRVNPTGSVAVYTGAHSHGQGHETALAQIVSDRLGIAIDDVDVIHGDTAKVQYGVGTFASRSLSVGGSAVMMALDKIIAKGRRIAAHMLEAATEDIEFDRGRFTVGGTDRSISFGEIAFSAHAPVNYPLDELEPGLDENAFYDPANFTYPAGSYVCEVEIDPETGTVEIVRFTAIDDFGRVINPILVAGQVHGGLAQGIGQALHENCVYDRNSGQLLTGSYMDYCMPRADDLPNFDIGLTETPCTHNPLGVKGCGEAGAIGAPPAVINAITDALGVRTLDMPATPQAVWRAIRNSRSTHAAS